MRNRANTWLINSCSLNVFILVALIQSAVECTEFPSIILSPYNPVFSCDEPTLNVKLNDIVRFICPFYDAGFRTPAGENTKPLYESLYFLNGNRHAYDTCNATNARPVLVCDNTPTATKGNSFQLQFFYKAPTAESFEFDEGQYFYFIGTGFRTKSKIQDRLGGSCNTTQTTGIFKGIPQYKIRLRVYVCKSNEECNSCTTNECYSKDCHCTAWRLSSTNVAPDFTSIQNSYERTCKTPYEEKNRTETKTVTNTTLTLCSKWKVLENSPSSKCMFLNSNTSSSDKCTDIVTMQCQKDDLSFQSFCQYVPALSDCHCTAWRLSSTNVAPDFTSIQNSYERTCKTPYEEKNRTETKTVTNTTLTSCSKWKVLENSPSAKCMFLNANTSSSDKCTDIVTMQCQKDDLSFQSFCQYVPALSDCHCTAWRLSSTNVAPDFTSIQNSYERTCKTPYEEKNRTETKTVTNTTLTSCSEWGMHVNNGFSPSNCLYLRNETSSINKCTALHTKNCKNTQNTLEHFCQYLPTKCPECSEWIKTSETRSENFTQVSEKFQKYCPNGTTLYKTNTTACDLNCTPWLVHILKDTNQCMYTNNEVANLLPGQCSRLHRQSCESKDCKFNVSLCQNIGITCPTPTCGSWTQVSSQPNTDFTELFINQTRSCISSSSSNVTEYQEKTCPLSCTATWERIYDAEKHAGCVLLPSKATTQCTALHVKRCGSESCGIETSYCKYSDVTCPPTPQPSGQVGSQPDSSSGLFLSVGIPVVLLMFIIGVALGFVGHKKYHRKDCLNFRMKHNQVNHANNGGVANLAYQTSVSERPESVYYVDGNVSGEVFEQKEK